MKRKAVTLAVCFVMMLGALFTIRTISAGENTAQDQPVKTIRQKPAATAPLALNTFTATPNVAIPDNAYNGTLVSMACSTINTSSLPTSSFVGAVRVQIAMTHTFVGDLTIKLISPSGSVLGLVSRPGAVETADDGTDAAGFGENSNLLTANPLTYADAAATSAEQMGKVPIDLSTIQTICVDGGTPCEYRPAPSTIAGLPNFAGFGGQNAVGLWQLCIGDSAAADTGTFSSWTLSLATFPTTAANASISGRVLTAGGHGVSNATIVLTGGELSEPRFVRTGAMGYYKIDDLPVGAVYVVTIQSKRYTFGMPTQLVNLQDSVAGLDFIANPD